MSKKKNTLKDLDEFLKQQAATLVAPPKLSEKIEEPVTPASAQEDSQDVSIEKILKDLNALAEKEGINFRKRFYDLIISSIENRKESLPEDKMLINTALYLKSGDRWKEVIREYWSRI
jgi:hypothetical protein